MKVQKSPGVSDQVKSSNKGETHSFYSEIDFSKEKLWDKTKQKQDQNHNLGADYEVKSHRKSNYKWLLNSIAPTYDEIPLNKNYTPFDQILGK